MRQESRGQERSATFDYRYGDQYVSPTQRKIFAGKLVHANDCSINTYRGAHKATPPPPHSSHRRRSLALLCSARVAGLGLLLVWGGPGIPNAGAVLLLTRGGHGSAVHHLGLARRGSRHLRPPLCRARCSPAGPCTALLPVGQFGVVWVDSLAKARPQPETCGAGCGVAPAPTPNRDDFLGRHPSRMGRHARRHPHAPRMRANQPAAPSV
jgi:hypothetical protein